MFTGTKITTYRTVVTVPHLVNTHFAKILEIPEFVTLLIDSVASGCSTMGNPEEQAQDELRETIPRSPLLLWQKHHSQNSRKEVYITQNLRDITLQYFQAQTLAYLIITLLLQIWNEGSNK